MKSQVLCRFPGEAAGEMWNWSNIRFQAWIPTRMAWNAAMVTYLVVSAVVFVLWFPPHEVFFVIDAETKLLELRVEPAVLSPKFSSSTRSYQATVPFETMVITLWGRTSTCTSEARLGSLDGPSKLVVTSARSFATNNLASGELGSNLYSKGVRDRLKVFDFSTLPFPTLTLTQPLALARKYNRTV